MSRSTSIRLLAAFILIAVSIGYILPPASAFSGQQSTTNARPKRGKNDSTNAPATSASQSSTAGKDDSEDPDDSAAPPPRNPTPRETSRPTQTAAKAQPRDDDSSLQTSEKSQSRSGRDVPAFDRPPLDERNQTPDPQPRREPQLSRSDDRRSAGGSREPQMSRRTSESSGTNSRDRSTGDIDDPNAPRGTQQRPELQRPTSPSYDPGGQSQRNQTPAQPGTASDRAKGQSQTGGDESIKIESTLVNLPLLVSDRSGRFIPQLSKKDFLLYEDGVQQEVASFGSEEVPFSVALLLDVSPSVQDNIPDIQDAALAFVRQLRSNDRVMVVAFDKRAHYLTDFTSDRRMLESAIRSISTGSGTSVYDAVYEAVAQKLRGVEGRKALILFSDGEDTTSNRATYDDAINIVTESDVLVYSLRYPGSGFGGGGGGGYQWPRFPRTQLPFPLPFPWPFPQGGGRRRNPSTQDPNYDPNSIPSRRSGRRGSRGGDFLSDLATAGGGPVFDAEQVGDLSRLATRIADELRHVYVISYYPTNPLSNGGYRAIRVSVKGRDDIAVRHRRGYNARDARSRPTI